MIIKSNSLKELLKKFEGLKSKPYLDIFGNITIGIGRNLTNVGISVDEIDMLFWNDCDNAVKELEKIFPNFDTFSINRKNALISVMFNLGPIKFEEFHKMIDAIKSNNWDLAAEELLDSSRTAQVGQRARIEADLIRNG